MQTQRMRAIETSERRMAALSASMDPCFIGKNVAVLHHTQFAYVEESTRTKVYDFATPKPRRFGEERVALNVAPLAMRGKVIMQEDAVMFMQIRPVDTRGLLTRDVLAHLNCEEVVINHQEMRDITVRNS